MNTHLIQAIFFSLWAVLILRMFRRAFRLHRRVALKQRRALEHRHDADGPMAIRVSSLPH